MKKPIVGVLALQGCVQPHRPHIERLNGIFKEIRTPQELDEIDGLILPGGESTTLLKLIDTFSFSEKLEATFKRVPVWGICAGAILIAKKVSSPIQKSFGLIDIDVERNAYGRQQESFYLEMNHYPVAFIRAPKITRIGEKVIVHAKNEGTPVWVQQGRTLVTTFHPEMNLDAPSPMHRAFVELIL